MKRLTWSHRVLLGVGIIVLSAVLFRRDASAQGYGNCNDVQAVWLEIVDLSYCGPYAYDNDALPGMYNTASSYVTSYNYGDDVTLYWWGRVSPLDQDAYYDSSWQINCWTICW